MLLVLGLAEQWLWMHKRARRNTKALCGSSILTWGTWHQKPGCKMPGTELSLCEGEQLLAEVVSLSQQPSSSPVSQELQQRWARLRWQSIFHQSVPKRLHSRQHWHLKTFSWHEKCTDNNTSAKTMWSNQPEQLYLSNLSLRMEQRGLQSTHPLPRNHEGEVLSAVDSLCITQYSSSWDWSYFSTYLFYSSAKLLYSTSLCLLFSHRCFNINYSNYPLRRN